MRGRGPNDASVIDVSDKSGKAKAFISALIDSLDVLHVKGLPTRELVGAIPYHHRGA